MGRKWNSKHDQEEDAGPELILNVLVSQQCKCCNTSRSTTPQLLLKQHNVKILIPSSVAYGDCPARDVDLNCWPHKGAVSEITSTVQQCYDPCHDHWWHSAVDHGDVKTSSQLFHQNNLLSKPWLQLQHFPKLVKYLLLIPEIYNTSWVINFCSYQVRSRPPRNGNNCSIPTNNGNLFPDFLLFSHCPLSTDTSLKLSEGRYSL